MFTTDIKDLYVIFHVELNIRWRVGMAPENHGHGWSSAPYGQSDSISRRWAASKPDSWKDDARAARLSSLPSCNSRALLNSARSNARKADLEAGPLDSLNKPTIGGGLRPCQSRNGATKSTIVRRAFPMTSRSHLKSPHENNRRSRAEHVTPETKNWTHAGKRNQLRACFKPIQASTNWILILTELVKIDLNAVTKHTYCSWSFGWLVKLWNRKNVFFHTYLKTLVCLCVCMSMSYQLIHLC